MKNKILYVVSIFVLLIISFAINSCEVTDPVEGLEVRLNTFARETLVSSYIYDANTLQAINGEVEITFSGTDASLIVDETNDSKTIFTAKNGIFIFGVKDGTEISKSNPVQVTATLKASGYDNKTRNIKITKAGNQTRNMFMVNPATLPSNSENETFSGGTTDNSGSLQQPVSYTTQLGSNLSVPSGTVLTNNSGQPLTGNITMNLSIIPLTAENSYNVPRDMITSGNELIDPFIKFSLSIIDGAGNSAENFSENVSFSLNVSDDLDIPYSEGETISVWKENSTTGLWEKVGDAIYSSSSSKAFSITTGSLSGTTSEPGELVLGNSSQTCISTVNITNLPDDFASTIQFFDSEGTLVGTTNNAILDLDISDSGLGLSTVRINADLDNPYTTGIELANNISIVCGTINLELSFPEELMSVRCEIIGVCTAKDPAVVVNPNMSFSYKKQGATTWQSNTLINGVAVVTGLEVGATYEITATYRDRTGNALFEMISPEDIQILEISNPENLLSSGVNSSTTPPTLFMEIDIEDECE